MFRLKFRYYNGSEIVSKEIDVGNVTSFSNSYSPTNTKADIPTQPAQNRFVMNTGVTRSFTITFTRVCPAEPNDDITADSTEWSNGFWAYIVRRFIVNRWQSETDGCKIYFDSPDEKLYPSIAETNVYVTGFVPEQITGATLVLTGSLKLTVGATNISKVSTKHTIIYHTNYDGNKEGYTGTESNQVKVWDSNIGLNSISIPITWLQRAQELNIISQDAEALVKAQEHSVWSTSSTVVSSSTIISQGDSIDLDDDTPNPLNLYAIYSET